MDVSEETKPSAILEFLGDSLVNNHRQRVDPVTLTAEGTVVALYFSAQWCPPCRLFTNQLKAFYSHVITTKQDVRFVVIFISSDEDEKDFTEYLSNMPWLAVDFIDRERELQLSQRFNIVGLPTLVLLDGSSGDVITDRGRSFVMEDPQAERFPWRA